VSRRSVDDGIPAATVQGAAIRLVHSGATEADAVRELIEPGPTCSPSRPTSGGVPPPVCERPAATAAADLLDAAAREIGRTKP
jgi:hypothetical protein